MIIIKIFSIYTNPVLNQQGLLSLRIRSDQTRSNKDHTFSRTSGHRVDEQPVLVPSNAARVVVLCVWLIASSVLVSWLRIMALFLIKLNKQLP